MWIYPALLRTAEEALKITDEPTPLLEPPLTYDRNAPADLIIKDALLSGADAPLDIAIRDGVIACVHCLFEDS